MNNAGEGVCFKLIQLIKALFSHQYILMSSISKSVTSLNSLNSPDWGSLTLCVPPRVWRDVQRA